MLITAYLSTVIHISTKRGVDNFVNKRAVKKSYQQFLNIFLTIHPHFPQKRRYILQFLLIVCLSLKNFIHKIVDKLKIKKRIKIIDKTKKNAYNIHANRKAWCEAILFM